VVQDQVSGNLEAFQKALPSLLPRHRGKHALIHTGDIIGLYSSSLAAVTQGYLQFGEGCFSVELIDDVPEDLGFFSHVSSALQA
jgi:hypothetical protein